MLKNWCIRLDLILLVCSSSPCLNGGQCFVINNNADFYCLCPQNGIVGGKRCDQLLISTTSVMPTSKYSSRLSTWTSSIVFVQLHSLVHLLVHHLLVEMVPHVRFHNGQIHSYVLVHSLFMEINVKVRDDQLSYSILLFFIQINF